MMQNEWPYAFIFFNKWNYISYSQFFLVHIMQKKTWLFFESTACRKTFRFWFIAKLQKIDHLFLLLHREQENLRVLNRHISCGDFIERLTHLFVRHTFALTLRYASKNEWCMRHWFKTTGSRMHIILFLSLVNIYLTENKKFLTEKISYHECHFNKKFNFYWTEYNFLILNKNIYVINFIPQKKFCHY